MPPSCDKNVIQALNRNSGDRKFALARASRVMEFAATLRETWVTPHERMKRCSQSFQPIHHSIVIVISGECKS